MRHIESVMVPRPVEKLSAWTCDFCGKHVVFNELDGEYPHDGFTFIYRQAEEDEVILTASDMCDECYYDEDGEFSLRLATAIAALVALAPHATIETQFPELQTPSEDA